MSARAGSRAADPHSTDPDQARLPVGNSIVNSPTRAVVRRHGPRGETIAATRADGGLPGVIDNDKHFREQRSAHPMSDSG